MTAAVPVVQMQGIEVPASSVDMAGFMAKTRRQTFQFRPQAWGGFGNTDVLPITQTGIISGVHLHFSGSLVVNIGTGTVATTARWPYDLFRYIRLSANGQSNLINASGWKLKARDVMARGDLTDRGVPNNSGGASPGTARTQGTLSLASESWGVGQNVSAVPSGTYQVDLVFFIPIAMDQVSLIGAIFAQTSATELQIACQYGLLSDLFTLTGNATVTLTGSLTPMAIVYDIPQSPTGDVIIPDLSQFHSLIETRYAPLANGANEITLVGQGVGRTLLRMFGQVWNGAAPQAPLPVTSANFAEFALRYGGNITPEDWVTGLDKRIDDERRYSSDIGGLQGFFAFDWVQENAFRDAIDEGSASQLRWLLNIPNAVSLTNAGLEYVQETLFAGSTGA